MNNPLLGLRTTIYKVNDIGKATEWYIRAFKTQPYFNEPFHVGFNIAGYELGLQPDETPAGSKSGNVLTYWGVENVEQKYEEWIGMGATAHESPQNVGGEIVVASVKDPWGNVIGLIYNPDFRLPG